MKVSWKHARVRHVGIALSPSLLVACLSRRRIGSPRPEAPPLWVRPLTPLPSPDCWTNLTEVLDELRTAVGGGTLHVALMPPLAALRQLELAGVNEVEAARVVQRDPSRFLPLDGRTETVIELEGSGWRRLSPFRLIATPASILEAVGAAARETGWSLGSVKPAALAWAGNGKRRRSRDCVACLGTHIEVVHAEHGVPTILRRLPRPAGELTAQRVRTVLAERGIEVAPDATVMLSDEEAMAVAAESAASALSPAAMSRQRTARRWRCPTAARSRPGRTVGPRAPPLGSANGVLCAGGSSRPGRSSSLRERSLSET